MSCECSSTCRSLSKERWAAVRYRQQCGILLIAACIAVVYLFLSAACPLASYLLRRFSVKLVMAFALLFNVLAVLLFALTPAGHACRLQA